MIVLISDFWRPQLSNLIKNPFSKIVRLATGRHI